MTTYVALLRGINVGGKAKVEMPRLRRVFEEVGCAEVTTYINSGNVLFRDARSRDELVRLSTRAVEKEFGFPISVLLRDRHAMDALCEAIPPEWTNDGEQKTDVLFLDDEIDSPGILDSIVFDPAVENVLYAPGAVVWNIKRENQRRGSSVKLVRSENYRHMTARNVSTVRKLRGLMAPTDGGGEVTRRGSGARPRRRSPARRDRPSPAS